MSKGNIKLPNKDGYYPRHCGAKKGKSKRTIEGKLDYILSNIDNKEEWKSLKLFVNDINHWLERVENI